ncbi:hypothetical protein CORC01_00589 [Colletotrichum orchidophilum]|uniref:Uncharacterized protein n=1 Tax=Colletotrichum orchidophilum TaxID=1209926 RepID=A0A1G4BS79_9PEZI|nr:uncharacterized protein CORC01_00589 [Colletotrichum orchidophilum]OHF04250.1 hypothetical protein CORC01_00589 [Colletotrichum orchidophilum]
MLVQRNGPVDGAETAWSGAIGYEGPVRTLHRWGRRRRCAVDQPGTVFCHAQTSPLPDSFPTVGPGLDCSCPHSGRPPTCCPNECLHAYVTPAEIVGTRHHFMKIAPLQP